MRAILLDGTFRGDLMVLALLINAVYLCAAVVLYLRLLDSARTHGSLLQSGE